MYLLDITNYYHNIYAAPHFLACLIILGLMIFFTATEGKSFVCLSLLFLSTTLFIWMFNNAMLYSTVYEDIAIWWAKAGYLGIAFLPASSLQFAFALLGIYKKHKKTVWALWIISYVFLFSLLFTDSFILNLELYWWGYYPIYGWIGKCFSLFTLLIFIYCAYHFTREYKKADKLSLQRARARSCMIAFGIGYIGSIDYLPTFGIAIYPFGYIPVLLLLGILAYTALRYRLDITPSIAAKSITDTMSDALVILNEDGMIVLNNAQAEKLLNVSANELYGHKLSSVTGWDLFAGDLHNLAESCPLTDHPTILKVKDKTYHLEISVTVMRKKRRLLAFVCLLRDVTQRKINEDKLKDIHNKLEQRVSERTSELIKANLELEQEAAKRDKVERERTELIAKSTTQGKLASLGEIATGIAHEINQPLSFIRIIFESTQRDIKAGQFDPKELKEDCQEALNQVSRITTIINHLRTFGREHPLFFEKVDIGKILDNSLILLTQTIKLKNIDFVRKISEDLPQIDANPHKLEQVFINLIQNSIDALSDTKGGKIQVEMEADQNNITITYEDDGPGIPKENHSKIFEPFFSTKEVGKGTGLGLSIVFGIIQEHSGSIEYRDRGKGACFVTKIPIINEKHTSTQGNPNL